MIYSLLYLYDTHSDLFSWRRSAKMSVVEFYSRFCLPLDTIIDRSMARNGTHTERRRWEQELSERKFAADYLRNVRSGRR